MTDIEIALKKARKKARDRDHAFEIVAQRYNLTVDDVRTALDRAGTPARPTRYVREHNG